LGVIYWIHTQLQLWLIGFPTVCANQDVDLLRLDNQRTQLAQAESKSTTVADRNRNLTGGKTITH
jgi:hypothetical protein